METRARKLAWVSIALTMYVIEHPVHALVDASPIFTERIASRPIVATTAGMDCAIRSLDSVRNHVRRVTMVTGVRTNVYLSAGIVPVTRVPATVLIANCHPKAPTA